MPKQSTKAEREEMKAVLSRYPGTMSEIAKVLGIRASNVSNWLADRSGSKRFEKAVKAKVRALLSKEALSKPLEDVNGPPVRAVLDKLRKSSSGAE